MNKRLALLQIGAEPPEEWHTVDRSKILQVMALMRFMARVGINANLELYPCILKPWVLKELLRTGPFGGILLETLGEEVFKCIRTVRWEGR
jgi:hypothetical protein